jgi:16S rRNA (cytosine1402-N4)-methyltransferase
VISFHSLEDRIVKHYFLEKSKVCICPPDFPQCVCGKKAKAQILTRKPITASDEEIPENSRSKPAKLRVIKKY